MALRAFLLFALLGFLSPILGRADNAATSPSATAILGTWEKTYPNGEILSLTFKPDYKLEIKYPPSVGGDHDLTLWRLKGSTALLFSSDGGLEGKMHPDGKLLIVGQTFGKPLYDLTLTKQN